MCIPWTSNDTAYCLSNVTEYADDIGMRSTSCRRGRRGRRRRSPSCSRVRGGCSFNDNAIVRTRRCNSPAVYYALYAYASYVTIDAQSDASEVCRKEEENEKLFLIASIL